MERGGEPVSESELDRARRLATEMLMERLADDALELEEFERRLDQVNGATTVREVADVLGEVAAQRARGRPPSLGFSGSLARALPELPSLEPLEMPKGLRRLGRRNSVVLAFQDGAGKVGPWTPSRHVWVVNMLGAAVMDFREARLPPGITELTVFCIMGDVEVIVPFDLQVEFGGLGLIGGFDCEATVGVSNPDAPVLRINGVSCLGGVSVAVRDRGGEETSAPDIRRRRRAERFAPAPSKARRLERASPSSPASSMSRPADPASARRASPTLEQP
jgi:hypothetical protein